MRAVNQLGLLFAATGIICCSGHLTGPHSTLAFFGLLISIFCGGCNAAFLLTPSYRASDTHTPDRDTAAHCYRTAAERDEYPKAAPSGPKLRRFEPVVAACPKCAAPHTCRNRRCDGPKCNTYARTTGRTNPRACSGSWLRGCRQLRTEHLHQRCASCGAKWVMGTADGEVQ